MNSRLLKMLVVACALQASQLLSVPLTQYKQIVTDIQVNLDNISNRRDTQLNMSQLKENKRSLLKTLEADNFFSTNGSKQVYVLSLMKNVGFEYATFDALVKSLSSEFNFALNSTPAIRKIDQIVTNIKTSPETLKVNKRELLRVLEENKCFADNKVNRDYVEYLVKGIGYESIDSLVKDLKAEFYWSTYISNNLQDPKVQARLKKAAVATGVVVTGVLAYKNREVLKAKATELGNKAAVVGQQIGQQAIEKASAARNWAANTEAAKKAVEVASRAKTTLQATPAYLMDTSSSIRSSVQQKSAQATQAAGNLFNQASQSAGNLFNAGKSKVSSLWANYWAKPVAVAAAAKAADIVATNPEAIVEATDEAIIEVVQPVADVTQTAEEIAVANANLEVVEPDAVAMNILADASL